MVELPVGAELKTDDFRKKVRVIKALGRCGHSIVYQVTMDGKPKALKWHHKSAIRNKERKIAL